MANIKKKDEFAIDLMFVLRKIVELNCHLFDNSYLEKLLSYIKYELNKRCESFIYFQELTEWLSNILQSWKINYPNVCVKDFICQFIEILIENEQGFDFVQKINAVDKLMDVLQDDLLNNSMLKVVYIRLLSVLMNHKSGYNWIKNTEHWKGVIKLYFVNSNIYVEREGVIFIKKLISRAEFDENLNEDILKEITLPLSKNKLKIDENIMPLMLKLLEMVLKEYMFLKNNTICLKLMHLLDVEPFLNFILQHCNQERILDAASTCYVVFLIVKYEDKQKILLEQHIPCDILKIFYILLKKNHIEIVIKLAKFCQILWSKMQKELKYESTIGMHFIILQLVPVLIYNKNLPDTKLFDLFVQKLFALTSDSTQKLAYCIREVIRSTRNSKARDWALKGVLSVIGNIESLSHDEAVLIFQTMAYIVQVFFPDKKCDKEISKEILVFIEDSSLLSAVLNVLCTLIEKFKINWAESLESLCLLKMTCNLLQNTHFSCRITVQTLLLMKLAILNFMSPNLALLLNNTEDSVFECLMPLLYKYMHDRNWEIRDSSIEIVAAIAELAESKYPAFQQLLIEKDFCTLILHIMESDSESYVRASALRALSAMTKIKILNVCLNKLNFPLKMSKILQNESEGIVRREAALLIKQIYLTLNEQDELLNSFYQIMGYTAICDLHWEVRVNSLIFWEAVIQQVITDQGMIDGSFPKVTFSKEHKKIVTLTNDEIKIRLDKVLKELSKVGCLYVLLSTLNDDCDLPVVIKSTQILTDFLNILKRYNVITSQKDIINKRISIKRKNADLNSCEKRKPPESMSTAHDFLNENMPNFNNDQSINSDAIIEEIVNEMDINLLVTVYHPKEETSILKKKVLLQAIKPETFLMQMEGFDSQKFLEDKQKWFMNMQINLKSIINDIIRDSEQETNIMDCY